MDEPYEFENIVRRHRATVCAALRLAGIDYGDVDDLCQITFLTAHRRQHRFRPGCSMRGWLRSIARLVACNHHRGERRRRHRVAQFAVLSAGRRDEALHTMFGLDLPRLLGVLPKSKRDVVRMRLIEGLSVQETALALQINPHTVRSRLSAARRLMQRHIH